MNLTQSTALREAPAFPLTWITRKTVGNGEVWPYENKVVWPDSSGGRIFRLWWVRREVPMVAETKPESGSFAKSCGHTLYSISYLHWHIG